MDPENERQIKQDFLKEEILDKNFNPEDFIAFCQCDDRGADIDLYSLDDLKEIVSRFVVKATNHSSSNLNQTTCSTLEPTILSSEQIKVVITKPEKFKANIFSSDYFLYYVVSMPLGWSVQRQFSDFKWLEEALSLEFPGFYIPTIPEVKKKKFEDPLYLNIQIKQLELFINYIVSNESFKRSVNLVSFLSEEDKKNFSKIKRKKLKRIREITNIATAEGSISCDHENNQEFTHDMTSYLDSQKELNGKLIKESKKIRDILCGLCSSLKRFCSIMEEMSNTASKLPVKSRPVKEYYSKAQQGLLKINEKIWTTIVSVNNYLVGTNKFMFAQDIPLKVLYKDKDLAFLDSDSMNKKLMKTVDKGLSEKTIEKNNKISNKAGVLNYLCKDQSEKYLIYSTKSMIENFTDFSRSCSEALCETLEILSSIENNINLAKTFL